MQKRGGGAGKVGAKYVQCHVVCAHTVSSQPLISSNFCISLVCFGTCTCTYLIYLHLRGLFSLFQIEHVPYLRSQVCFGKCMYQPKKAPKQPSTQFVLVHLLINNELLRTYQDPESVPPPLYEGLKAAVTDSLMQLPNYNVNALIGIVRLDPAKML